MFCDPAVRESIPGLLTDLRADSDIRRLMTERLDAAARTQLTSLVDDAASQGRVRPRVDVDTVMDAIGGAAMYAVCVRGIDEQDIERAAADLADLILRGLLDPIVLAAQMRCVSSRTVPTRSSTRSSSATIAVTVSFVPSSGKSAERSLATTRAR